MTIAPELALDPFDFFRELVYRRSGIVLSEEKRYLVETRLGPVAQCAGCADLAELMRAVRRRDAKLEAAVVDAMTTNETSWFRDNAPFEALRQKAVPDCLAAAAARRRLAIWSAACSTGQELYTVAMVLDQHFPELGSWSVELLGTDLSTNVLERARQGAFSALEINRGLPAPLLLRYFVRTGANFQIAEELRRRVRFEQVNLTQPWPATLGAFDIVLLRNVLIYFDLETKRRVLASVRAHLRPGGYLLLGAAETTRELTSGFTPVPVANTTIYRLEEA